MITRDEAIKIAREFLEKDGLDSSDQNPTAHLITLQSMESSKLKVLKEKKPHAWKLLQEIHSDHWQILFHKKRPKTTKPGGFSVNVDAESGRVDIVLAF